MSIKSFRYFIKGIELRGEATNPTDNINGSLFYNSVDERLRGYLQGAVRNIVTDTQTQTLTNKTLSGNEASNFTNAGSTVTLPVATDTLVGKATTDTLTNKTIDANGTGNSISNLETADLAAGVLNISSTLASASDTQVPSALAAKTYIESVQTGLADHIADTVDAHDASAISNTPSGNLAATDQQAVNNELQTDIDTRATTVQLDAHLNDATDAHDASAISNIPSGNLTATDIQSAVNELQTDIDTNATNLANHLSDAADAHDASAISNIPSGNLAATDIQAAVNELQTDVDTRATTVQLDAHLNDTVDAHDASAISNIPSGNLAATDVQGALNELQNDINTRALTTGGSIITPARLDMKQDTYANLATYAATATDGQLVFATDTEETFVIVNNALSAVGGGGGTGVGSVNILNADTADGSALGDYTQTGLEIVTAPIVLHGLESFRLQHTTSIKSFKKVIAVDKKFRGRNNTVSLDVLSSATSGNLNIVLTDETNSTVLAASQAIPTNSTAITATTANTSNQLTGMTNAVLNSLSVGMLITGSAIPVGTTITAISATAATMSQNATGVSTGIRVSALVARESFTVDIPANCLSFSWTIASVVEVYAESYIDDIVVELTSVALTSASITIPVNNDTDWASATFSTLAMQGFGTIVNTSLQCRRLGGNLELKGRFQAGITTASEAQFLLPNNFGTIATQTITGTETGGFVIRDIANINVLNNALVTSGANYFRISAPIVASAVNPNTAIGASTSFATGDFGEVKVSIPIAGWSANETESVTIPLTTAQLVQQPDSYLRLNTSNGYGSTNTMIRRFSNISTNIGSDIQYTDSATLGASFTALTEGQYTINYYDSFNVSANLGLSLNSTQLTTQISTITNTERLGMAATAGTNTVEVVSWTGHLNVGDVIRPHNDGTTTGIASRADFYIAKQGSLKQLNPSSDSKITIPTHQLRFEGASARGSTDTFIAKFDTQAITQGDAWSVVNSAANGTVITMLKAGKLDVSSTIASSATNGTMAISKNQQILTANPVAGETFGSTQSFGVNPAIMVSGSFQVAIGDKIRIVSSVAITANASNNFMLSLTETSIPANFSNVLPQWSQSDSYVRATSVNGYGSTATKIRRFSNVPSNAGTAITYADSATNGASFTINESGIYNISFTDSFSGASQLGITVNQSSLITNSSDVPNNELLATTTTAGASYEGNCSWTGFLVKGDVIRAAANGGAVGDISATSFTISKVGKPNLSSVDVTSFVNMKTTDTQSSTLLQTATLGTVTISGTLTSNTNTGIYSYSSTTGIYTALKDANIYVNATLRNTTNLTTVNIFKNSTVMSKFTSQNNAQFFATTAASFQVNTGDTFKVTNTEVNTTDQQFITVVATADNNATASPTQQISSDTLSFVFKATAIDPATDAVGTFNTYTYAINTNTATIGATAPTQTVASMNVDGVRVFARAYNAASTTASPARVDIFIGKGLKSKQVDAYSALLKTSPIAYDAVSWSANAAESGATITYSETTGTLSIDCGNNIATSTTNRYIDKSTTSTSGYFVFNASRSPSLVTIPNLAPRIAYLSDVKANGTAGGSNNGTVYATRALNTLVDNTGIVTSLSANQFILPAGTYSIDASAPVGGVVNQHRIRIRNITDGTTPPTLLGSSEYNTVSTCTNKSTLSGEITITSAKTFELQHYCALTVSPTGFGVAASSGESEVYAQVKITRIK